MRASKRTLAGLSGMVLVAACASNPAPRGWLAPATEATKDPYGAWVSIEHQAASKQVALGGELIAVGRDSVFVLTPDGRFHAIAQADALRATVAYYDSQYGDLSKWTIAGSLSTVSHGFLLLASFPFWNLVGWTTTGAQSRAPLAHVREPRHAWSEVARYARFPQGLPAEMNRNALLPKQLPHPN